MTDNKRSDQKTLNDQSIPQQGVLIGLNAVIVSVQDETPYVLEVARSGGTDQARPELSGLPFGPYEPERHRTMEIGLRNWVEEQTYLDLGYVEQLYTFGDRGRYEGAAVSESRMISVGYLALTQQASKLNAPDSTWRNWYTYFPWEDWRDREPVLLAQRIKPGLKKWADQAPESAQQTQRWDRASYCFGFDGRVWDEEKVLERYELLYEASLVAEAYIDRKKEPHNDSLLGESLMSDHRRILATGMSRLRAKLKYRPVVFELMPDSFTLLQLQQTVEAISGVRLHKQNFRRLVEKEGLVERTGKISTRTGGRPAEEFRFRREVLTERPASGLRVRTTKRG